MGRIKITHNERMAKRKKRRKRKRILKNSTCHSK